MTRAFNVVMFAAIVLRPLAAAAQPSSAVIDPHNGLSLELAIAEGLRAEPNLRAAGFDVDVARGDARQARVRPNPDVSFEQREQTGGPDRQTSVGVDLPLDLFRRTPRIEAAERMVEAADAGLADRRRLLASSIRQQYGDALIAARGLDVLDAVLAASRRTYELLRNRVAEGAAPPLERDVALVELRRLEADRELAVGRVAVAMTRLKALLGRGPESPLTLKDSLESIAGPVATASGGLVLADRPDIRQAEIELAVARARTNEARQERKPDLSVFGGYMRMDESFAQQGLGPSGQPEPIHGIFQNASGGVRLSIPIFSRGQGTVAAAKARELAVSAMLNGRRLAAAAEVAAAASRLDAAQRALSAYAGDNRTLAQRNLDVVRETYTLGRATLFDVLTEQRRYLEFESGYTGALAEAFSAQSDLQRAKGELK